MPVFCNAPIHTELTGNCRARARACARKGLYVLFPVSVSYTTSSFLSLKSLPNQSVFVRIFAYCEEEELEYYIDIQRNHDL